MDRNSDPEDAEIAVSVLEWELGHPQKGFDQTLDCVIQDAIDSRAGCAMLDFDPSLGSFNGETFWRWKDARLIMFEPGFEDPHHMQCGWLIEAQRMPVAKIKAMGKLKGKAKWYGTEHIIGDASAASAFPGEGATSRLERMGVPAETIDDDHAWVFFCWYKNDEDTYRRRRDEQEIPEGERYMGCDNPECAYRSMTQDELTREGKLGQGETLPDEMDPCPACGGHLSRRDIRAKEEDVLAYPRGRRLVIMPALQQLPDDEPFYDDGWPIPTARSFPILWITCYPKGGRPMGQSDTTLNWDAQIASDQLLTMAFDRIMSHQTYYLMPSVGINDAKGMRYEFRDDQFNVMFADMSDPNRPAPDVDVIKGAALDPAWNAYWGAVQQTLLGPQGTNDMGLTQENSKNIAAATVAQLDRIGNIPVEHFNRRKNDALRKAYGVHWDYLRFTYTSQRLARLQIGDEQIVDRLRGDELPNFDFVVSETPPFTGLEKARHEAAQLLIEVAESRPQWLDLIAEVNQFPRSIVRKVKRQLQAQAAAAQHAALQGPPIPPELGGGFMEEPNPLDMVRPSAPEVPAGPAVPQMAA